MPITPDGRWSPNDSDNWDLTTHLAAMQVSNMEATNNSIRNNAVYRTMTEAQRAALPLAQRVEGLRVWTTDTRLNHLYTGGAWASETPWTTLTLVAGTGFSHSSRPLQAKRFLNRVAFRGAVYNSTAPGGAVMANLPANIPSPNGQVSTVTRLELQQRIVITTTGGVIVASPNVASSGGGYSFDGVGYDL